MKDDAGKTVIKPLDNSTLKLGDVVVTKILLEVDRPMEYIQLKDMRGSGIEPSQVISTYSWQDGLGYYASIRDDANYYYIDYLPKGQFVFEYKTYVQHEGKYESGIAALQSMYAPEFNSHSNSTKIVVRDE